MATAKENLQAQNTTYDYNDSSDAMVMVQPAKRRRISGRRFSSSNFPSLPIFRRKRNDDWKHLCASQASDDAAFNVWFGLVWFGYLSDRIKKNTNT